MAAAGDAPAVRITSAPVNPAFLRYLESRGRMGAQAVTTTGQHGLGYIPSPVDLASINAASGRGFAPMLGPFAATFDLRGVAGKLSAVRDQGQCGTCWDFATFGAMESALRPGETWDFSENNLNNNHGFDFGPCQGGGETMSAAYLARRDGPVTEADDPYNPVSPYTSPAHLTVRKHVKEILFLPDRTAWNDNDVIKWALTTYGAVLIPMNWSNGSFNAATNSYYDTGATKNHMVDIVGWDDNYANANFNGAPPHNGAFIVRNSWGTGWALGGYFYMSYDSNVNSEPLNATKNWCDITVFATAQDPPGGAYAYQYDPLGWVSSYGAGGATPWIAWMGNVFTGTAFSETLSQVGFYTTAPSVAYTVDVYTGANAGPTSGALQDHDAGTFDYAGYHTVTLTSPVTVQNKQKFSVVVKLTDPNLADTTPVAVQTAMSGYSSRATSSNGQSYISADGFTWTDLNQAAPPAAAAVKALMTGRIGIPAADAELKGVRAFPNPARLSQGGQVQIDTIPADIGEIKISIFTMSGKLVRTLSEGNGVATAGVSKVATWDGRNASGEKVASGVYIYVITSVNYSKKTGKIGVLW